MSASRSPDRISDPFDNGRWTVDNSESRFSSRFGARSPARSILKSGSQTPNLYNSPNRSRPERRHARLARHVSFSPFDRVRFFGEGEATSESGRDRFRSADQRGPDSAVFDADPVASPQLSAHPFLSRLTGSPSDHRKRRPDLFGSPPVHDANSPKRRFTAKMHKAQTQLNEFDNDNDEETSFNKLNEDDNDNDEETSFNKYFEGRQPPTAADIFDTIDDDGEPMELTQGSPDMSQLLFKQPRTPLQENEDPVSKTIAHDENAMPQQLRQEQGEERRRTSVLSTIFKSPTPQSPFRPNSNSDMELTQQSIRRASSLEKGKGRAVDNILRSPIAVPEPIKSRLSIAYDAASEAGSDMELTQETQHANVLEQQTATQSRYLPHPRASFVASETNSDMDVTMESRRPNVAGERTPIQNRPITKPHASLALSEANNSDMDITMESRRPNVAGERTPTQSRPLPQPRASLALSEANNSDMEITQEAASREDMLRRLRANIAMKVYSPINRNRTSIAVSDVGSDMELTQEFNRNGDNNQSQARPPIRDTSRSTTPKRLSVAPSAGVISDRISSLSATQGSFHNATTPTTQRAANILDEQPGALNSDSILAHDFFHERLSTPSRRPSNVHSATGSEFGSDYADGAGNILDEELSQLYDSSTEIGEPSPPSPPPPPPSRNIPLSEFLLYNSISFGNSKIENDRRRTSGFDTSEGPVKISEQALAAATTIPELEMCKTHCGELKELIAADEEVIARIDREVSTANPSMFKEYLDADLNTQNDMAAKLKKIKDYAGFKALHTLLEWKQTKNDSLIQSLQPCVQKISEEEQYHEAFEQRIRDSSHSMKKHLAEIKQKLADARIRLEERRQVVYADESKQNEINDQRATLDGYRVDVAKLAEIESSVMDSLRHLSRRKEELEAETAKLEQAQGVTIHPEKLLQKAQDKFEKSRKYSQLRVIERSNEALKVEIMGDILVRIKSPSQFPRQPDAVQVKILNDSYYERISPLVNGLHAMVKDLENTEQIVETIAIYWNQAREIYRELIKAGARYYMEIVALDTEDESEQGVRCTLVPTSFIHRTKVTITLDLRPQDLSKFPVINMDTVTVTYNRGPTDATQEQVENVARELLRRHGFINLKGTLQKILERIRSNPTFPITPLRHL